MRSCDNCKNRCSEASFGIDMCIGYEIAESDDELISNAKNCKWYEEGTPDCLRKDGYCPSSTNGDYSPSNPWDAPGMSIKDFI